MKTYCKLLATSWMVLRPLCPNVHADNDIHWREISHFFNFSTIVEEEKRTNLETNIRLLVEEQLKLPSGKNLWKAFQFWEKQHPELGFLFEFTLTSNPGAEVVLESLKYSFEGKQVFCFEILINKLFAEKLEIDRILSENMLYRPCLIKLVDSDDPEKWEYHLREQKLPFFITLAHEFLHALNQLERIDLYWFTFGFDSQDKDILAVLEATIPMENFLAEKLGGSNNSVIFQKPCSELWGNNHFWDEMTVILGSKRKIGEVEFVFIGETTFLREYFQDNTIISWSHDSARNINFWQKMSDILQENYVQQTLFSFGLEQNNIHYFYIDENQSIEEKYYFYKGNSCQYKELQNYLQNELNIIHIPIKAIMLWENTQNIFVGGRLKKIPNIQFWHFVVYPTNDTSIHLLPKYTEIKKEHNSYAQLKELFGQLDEEKINFIKL